MKKFLLFLCLWIPWSLSSQDVISVQLENSDNVIIVNISGDNNVVNVYPPPPPTPPSGDALKLMFDDIANASLMIGGTASDVADWNTFFDLPDYGGVFTSVTIDGDTVELSGGDGITLRGGLFSNNDYYASIIGVVDEAGCLDSLECLAEVGFNTPFYYNDDEEIEQSCTGLAYFEAENITTAGIACFMDCVVLTTTNNIIIAGDHCFNGCTALTSTGSVTTAGNLCFISCTALTSTGSITTAGYECFQNCTALVTIDLSECTNLGTTTGDDFVFEEITGNTITVTCAAGLLTCNEGAPDADLCTLAANNTVILNGNPFTCGE